MEKNKISGVSGPGTRTFVCQRCEVRLSKSADFKGVGFSWTAESFKELKLEFIRKFGRKPNNRVVMTSCLGHCPEKAVSYEDVKDGKIGEAQNYPMDLDRQSVFELFFK